MISITCASLSGGQGKTTSAIFLGRALAALGHRVLLVDADPQASLTFWLGYKVNDDEPTLLEVIKGLIRAEEGIYRLPNDNLWLIPSDNALATAQDFLSSSGAGAAILQHRLKPIAELFTVCIIDAPPSRTQIFLTTIGAANEVLIPAETTSKGLNSVIGTVQLIQQLQEVGMFTGAILGIVPFRDKWTGFNQAKQSKKAVEAMRKIAGDIPMLPSILESEQFKRAIDQGVKLSDLGYAKLEFPFENIISLLESRWPILKTQLIGSQPSV